MTRTRPASSSIRLIARDGELICPLPQREAADGGNPIVSPLPLPVETRHSNRMKWVLSPPLLVELVCCLVFAMAVVLIGCTYVVATRALLPALTQNYPAIW